ncbi:MAG TPA: glycosyltransferase family 39 protein [Gemmatimonadales bacterium]|nr:glycosyltransferase family 39 protein [Gemmatimonadales bacterium]
MARRPDRPLPGLPVWSWLVAWCALVGIVLALRPLLPVDETRYLSVAWEMWRHGDWLVPHLNGAPYSDKPPALFWGILLGWRVFGVGPWWPRLLPPLLGLVSALLLARLSARLGSGPAGRGALPFLSGLLWVTYSTMVLFDTLLTACVLIAVSGVVEAWRGRTLTGWLACGAGIGLGALSKGPVVLVHVLPVALLAPWWAGSAPSGGWTRWYGGALAATMTGAAIGFAWALPAAAHGGAAYRSAILWDQTAGRISGRITGRLAHPRPWWWYLAMLPVVLYPWGWWPPLWRALARRRRPLDVPARFALAWVVPGVVVLSSFGGKQVQYLMPLLPGFALLAAAACADLEPRRWDAALPAAVLALAGGVLVMGETLWPGGLPRWLGGVSPGWGVCLLTGALGLALARGGRGQVVALSLTCPLLLIGVHLAGAAALRRSFDLEPVAAMLKRGEQAGRPIAYVGPYSGQFHFLGRLDRPFEEIPRDSMPAWSASHPLGLVVRVVGGRSRAAGALIARPYGEYVVAVWSARGLR